MLKTFGRSWVKPLVNDSKGRLWQIVWSELETYKSDGDESHEDSCFRTGEKEKIDDKQSAATYAPIATVIAVSYNHPTAP